MIPKACIGLLLLVAVGLWAQAGGEGTVEGTITDPTGAVLSGAIIEAHNSQTGAVIRTTSNDVGLFRFPVLPVGIYNVSAEHPGFVKLITRDVIVTVGSRVSFHLPLRIGSRDENVVVTAETPLVQATRSDFSSTVDEGLVASLPLNGRNLYGFVALVPGVTTGPNGKGLNFLGQRDMNSFLLDGNDVTDTFFATAVGGTAGGDTYQFSQEAVKEFQVNVNVYSVEFGRVGAGAINIITKSGTNGLHGTAFWYFRDKGLNATDLINKLAGQPKDPLHVHQFGGALGGPVVKNKLFFFGNYDGQRREESNLTFLNLPAGFQLSSNPTVAAFQRRALDYLQPRASSWIRNLDQDVGMAKIDWQVTRAHTLSGKWNRQRFGGEGLLVSGTQQSWEHTAALAQNDDLLAASLTSTVSASTVNVARFSYLRIDQPGIPNSANPEASIFEGGQQVLLIGRQTTVPRTATIRREEFGDTLYFQRGKHALKTGLSVLRDGVTFLTAINFSGSYRFNSLESFGRSLAGTPKPVSGDRYVQSFSGEGKPGNIAHPNATEIAGFIEDEWRMRSDLTLNLGFRYDVQFMANAPVKNPSLALADAGIDMSFVPLDLNNVAPRIGFAWSTFHQRLVVRGGYGLFYPQTNAGQAARAHYQNGVSVQTRTFAAGSSTAALIPAYPNTVCGPPESSGIPPSCPPPIAGNDTIMPFAPGYRQPVVQQASLGFAYEITKDLAVSVSYLTLKGTHLERYRDINLATPSPATIGIAGTNAVLSYQQFPSSRPIAGFDRILLLSSDANSIYHGLVLQLTKRFSRNYQLLAAYTLGKDIDDLPDNGPLNPGAGDARLLSNSYDPRLDRGPSDQDQRQRLVVSGVWQLDYAKHLPTAAKYVFGGWELSGIFVAQSGRPYSTLVNFDLNNDGNASTDRTPGVGRNSFYTPATFSFDPRLTRSIALSERLRLQFIWEAFNVFNRANITSVRTTQYSRSTSVSACDIAATPCLVPQNTGATAFGAPSVTSGPRIMQFAAKISF